MAFALSVIMLLGTAVFAEVYEYEYSIDKIT